MARSTTATLLALLLMASEAAAQFCPGLPPWVFDDVPSTHPFCTDITWMAERGVTLGCSIVDPNHRLYCPNESVSRGQMAAFMHRLGDALFPLSCAAGQVMKWNGLAWACANDNIGGAGGGGTVTSVAAETGLTAIPNPIVGAGVLSLATSYRLPQACAASQIPKWNGAAWTCAADAASSGTVTSLNAGVGITLAPNPIVGAGTISADTTYFQRRVSQSCVAGSSIRVIAADGTVTCEVDSGTNAFVHGGNAFGTTAALGTTDDQPLELRVNNIRVMRYEPSGNSPNVIGGSSTNNVAVGVSGATIAGGGGGVNPNQVTGTGGTVGGGVGNEANGGYSTVGGGYSNLASGNWGTVTGGFDNTASGFLSTVAGGSDNTASGDYSFAAGQRAQANHEGAFVWADSRSHDFASTSADSFRVRATGGGVRLVVAINADGSISTNCLLNSGSGGWDCSSDRNLKNILRKLDGETVLAKLAALPIFEWTPKAAVIPVRHFGPTAQDFHAAFGLGYDDKMIGAQDADGVALAAIQGLNTKIEAQAREIADLRRIVQSLFTPRD